MAELIIISKTRDHDCPIRTKKRLIELNKLNVNELDKIVQQCGIKKYNLKLGNITKKDLINGIILHEKMLLGDKQTELTIKIDNQNKSYFIKTINKFILVTKKNIDYKEFYNIKYNLCCINSSTEILYDDGRFSCKEHILQNLTNLYNDMNICRKAIIFIESYYFYLKVKYLLDKFIGINDIVLNICFVYFKRSLKNISDVNCKFE